MKYILMVVLMLGVSYMYTCLLMRCAKLSVGKDTEERKELICNLRTRLERVLEEEGENVTDYRIEAYISEGKIKSMVVDTDKTVGSVLKYDNVTEYSMKDKNGSIIVKKLLLTFFVFIILLFCVSLVMF